MQVVVMVTPSLKRDPRRRDMGVSFRNKSDNRKRDSVQTNVKLQQLRAREHLLAKQARQKLQDVRRLF